MNKLYEELLKAIDTNQSISDTEKKNFLKVLLEQSEKKANVLITGATGCGKSSTINAMFNAEKAKVGTGVDPETMEIAKYELGNLTLWDSPGLGDGAEADKRHAEGIINLLNRKDENGDLLIDVVLVILDGSSRDLGTSYELINKIIAPNLGEGKNKRLIIGINQADMAMKGRNWNHELHKPEPELETFLKEKEKSVHDRIFEGTGISVKPVSYAAGYKEDGKEQEPSYNLSKLIYYIIDSIPAEKRIQVVQEMNANSQVWQSNDEEADYGKEITKSASEGVIKTLKTVTASAGAGAAAGAAIGSVIPVIGTAIGTAVGAGVGAVAGLIGSVIDFFGF